MVPEGSPDATFAITIKFRMRKGTTPTKVVRTFGARGIQVPATAVVRKTLGAPLILAMKLRSTAFESSISRRCEMIASEFINSLHAWVIMLAWVARREPQVRTEGRLCVGVLRSGVGALGVPSAPR